jgi:hypothetical protein
VTAAGHDIDDLGERRVPFDGDDVGSRDHDVIHGAVADAEDIGEKHSFILVFVAGFFDNLVESISKTGFTVAHQAKPAQGRADDPAH